MQIQPKLTVTRFAQLEAGELFLFQLDTEPTFGMKVIDPTNGEPFILPLGPSFSQDLGQPRICRHTAIPAVSFGKDFVFRFSENPDGWSFEAPDNRYYCAALSEEVSLRANGSPRAGHYAPCWINIDGVIQYDRPRGISAFSIKWQILLPDGNRPPRLLVDHSAKPFGSA